MDESKIVFTTFAMSPTTKTDAGCAPVTCLTNLAISIVRVQGRFDFLPQAHRHYARRPQDAVRQLLEPPKP